VGYFVNIEYESEEMRENPPEVYTSLLSSSTKVLKIKFFLEKKYKLFSLKKMYLKNYLDITRISLLKIVPGMTLNSDEFSREKNIDTILTNAYRTVHKVK